MCAGAFGLVEEVFEALASVLHHTPLRVFAIHIKHGTGRDACHDVVAGRELQQGLAVCSGRAGWCDRGTGSGI